MEYTAEQKERVRQHIKNWKVVSNVMDEMRTEQLRSMSEAQSAEIFDGLDLTQI